MDGRARLLAAILAALAAACGGGDGGGDPGATGDAGDRDVPVLADEAPGDLPGTDRPAPGDEGDPQGDAPPDLPPPEDPGIAEDPGPTADPGPAIDPGPAPDPGVADPGAPDAGPQDTGPRHHPEGFGDPAAHGPALKEGASDCRGCHGDTLDGDGKAPSCNACHVGAWQSSCTFCHGGTKDPSGAPPRDLDGAVAPEAMTFRAHTAHVTRTRHPAYDCRQCHLRPAILLSPGHLFDDTPGVAEVVFQDLGQGAQRGPGTCANLYCHGNGQGPNGQAADADPTPSCSGCHPDRASGNWGAMSGDHDRHLGDGLECADCHGDVATGSTAIANPDLHVNGKVDTKLPGITRVGGTCSGSCHGEFHLAAGW